NNLGPDEILFQIGQGAKTIRPLSERPAVTEAVVFDGTSQPGFVQPGGRPLIELDGSLAGPARTGLRLTTGASTGRSLPDNRFRGPGIFVGGDASGSVIQGNLIGTDPAGQSGIGNRDGIDVVRASRVRIGAAGSGLGNVVSGNRFSGVRLFGASSTQIVGNMVGTNLAGDAALRNLSVGVALDGATENLIGGTAHGAGNLISGNGIGVHLLSGTTQTLVLGNHIGTDLAGTAAVPNGTGVLLSGFASNNTIGGTTAAGRN